MQGLANARLTSLGAIVALAGCAGPAPPPVKEVYVEVVRDGPAGADRAGSSSPEAEAGAPAAEAAAGRAAPLPPAERAFSLAPYPLAPDTEGRAYAVLRSFTRGREEAIEKLATVLGRGVDPAAWDGQDPPRLLFFPQQVAERVVSATYLGHAAWVREGVVSGPEIVHHLRVLVVNRLSRPVRVRGERVRLFAFQGNEPVALEPAAVADGEGRAIEALRVPGGDRRLLHAFFTSPRLDPLLRAAWQVDAAPPDDPGARSLGPWPFTADLRRCYQLDAPELSPLEVRVHRGETLPEYHEPPPPWREPRMEPVAPAPAAGG